LALGSTKLSPKAKAAKVRHSVLSIPTTPGPSLSAHIQLHFVPKTLLFSNPPTMKQDIMSRLMQNASDVPSERYQDLASSIVCWHFLHAGHGMTDGCDRAHASLKFLVTIDDVPVDVVRKEVRLFISCHLSFSVRSMVRRIFNLKPEGKEDPLSVRHRS
jgi:hypothetical protein